ncbi:mechanosensitive ion channel family protein [Microcoleus sp. FACHB-1515]|uniref:mechanosensitive ion channel family protein n=1 Tax=Cyanophyceae TaxID=3028117 RepID=UPI001682F04D|nr:mechanosensitive ion channel family protein [Microcoleus sp. FACHB-1515]MBD2092579.1 mechanosensitive ion channel family protein [Microcoleus sp. FACHB-1515]
MEILITVIEVGLIIAAFTLLNWLVRIGFRISGQTWLKSKAEKIDAQQRNIGFILMLICASFCLLIVGLNGVLIFRGESVQAFQLRLIQSVPRQFWETIAIATAKSVMLLLLIRFSIPILSWLLDQCSHFAKNYDRIKANDQAIEVFFTYLKSILTNSLWLFGGILCAQFFSLPAILIWYLFIVLRAYLAISLGRLMIKAVSALIDTFDALSIQHSHSIGALRYYERFRYLVPALKKTLEYILYVGIATLIVQDVDFIGEVAAHADEIILTIALYFIAGVLIEIANVILEDLVLRTDHLSELQLQRRLTIIPLFKSFLKYAIYFSAILLILNLFELNPAPLLAGAGLVGLIVGFGAQNLINDIVCGFFILFENYYLVGDYIEAGKSEDRSVEGIVEAIELRTTQIRHPDGQLQIVRNGEIGSIVNYSKQYIYAKVDVPIAHHSSLDQIYRLIESVGQELKADCPEVLEATLIDGLENFGEDNLLLRTLTKVKPGKHLYIQRLLRKRLKHRFDQEGIGLSASSLE